MPRAGKRAAAAVKTESEPIPIISPAAVKELVSAETTDTTVVAIIRDEVKINNSSATELKNACDDALKRYLALPDHFKPIHLHTDVRLALGWAGVVSAIGTGLYGYKTEFEASKPVVWAGLILCVGRRYVLLTTIQTAYAYFIEGNTVFVGKRKSFSKRIVTERITASSSTKPITKTSACPSYTLSLTYLQSASKGKSLLAKGKTTSTREYSTFFDSNGVMDQLAFETWINSLVSIVMADKSS